MPEYGADADGWFVHDTVCCVSDTRATWSFVTSAAGRYGRRAVVHVCDNRAVPGTAFTPDSDADTDVHTFDENDGDTVFDTDRTRVTCEFPVWLMSTDPDAEKSPPMLYELSESDTG